MSDLRDDNQCVAAPASAARRSQAAAPDIVRLASDERNRDAFL